MQLDDYLLKGENVVTSVEVNRSESPSSDGTPGDLACTSERVVFVADQEVADISLDGISSMSIRKDPLLTSDVVASLFMLFAAGIGFFAGIVVESELARIVSGALGALGILILLVALAQRKIRLRIRTANNEFGFAARDPSDLEDIPHAVRQVRAKKNAQAA